MAPQLPVPFNQGNLLTMIFTSPGTMLVLAILSLPLYLLATSLYNIYLHPLRSYPGPWLWRASRLPYLLHTVRGTAPFDVLSLHERYGAVVRIAPDELAFRDGAAWKDIYGHRTGATAGPSVEMPKSLRMYRPATGEAETIVNAGREKHGLLRRTMAHGFSDRSLREQQPLVNRYIDLLIQRLRENCEGGRGTVDMLKWYNFTTFDIIGDLAFGEAFGCLESGEYHPWVSMIFQAVKMGVWLQAINSAPWLRRVIMAFVPQGIIEKRAAHIKLTEEKLKKRMELGAERPDLMEGLLRKKDELNLSFGELRANSGTLIIAGSETTASLLSGVTYLLGTHPEVLAKLTAEVRTSFRSESEIDLSGVSNLTYMLACLDEALRIYPPAPLALPRVIPEGGGTIAGYDVPEGITVAMFHYAVYHSEVNFALPDEFHPERWLDDADPRFANDNRDALQAFSLGPRNCIGKNLAYVEMRLILARVLWNFDIRLAEDCKDWIAKQKIFLIWEKAFPLNVHLTPRVE